MNTPYPPKWNLGFASLREEVSRAPLEVTGTVPESLCGTMYGIGPAAFEMGPRTVAHWLDGFAMISSLRFDAQQVTFSNRFLASSWYRRALVEDNLPPGGFDSPVPHHSNCRSSDNANLNVISRNHELEALGDMPQSIMIDVDTLATRETRPWKRLGQCVASSPHPFFDENTGERFDLTLHAGDPSGYIVTVTDVEGMSRKLRTIASSRLGYMHSFSVTAHWVVLVEGPFTSNPRSLRSRRRPYLRNYVWDASRGTRIFVLDRRTGVLKTTLSTRPLFVLHHINAWDEGDQIVVDIAAYPDPSILDALAFDHGQVPSGDFPAPLATRLLIRLGTDEVACFPLKCSPGEFWKIDPRFSMQPATVLFSAGPMRTGSFIDRLCRSNLTTGGFAQWSCDNCYPGAPAFIASSVDAPEGEGWLLSIVLDVATKRSFVLVLDAGTLTEVARAWLPLALPFGLHTLFVPRETTV